jgi:hypothetical protein
MAPNYLNVLQLVKSVSEERFIPLVLPVGSMGRGVSLF